MPLHDFKCGCGVISERITNQSDINNQECPKCGKIMKQQFPNTFNFKLIYNNKTDICDWAGNTSMYWNDVKKQQKEEGKMITPVTENIK
jgi:ssDNA-binding Zn-finger/Zn-ribbon topoisomerase 1